MADRTHSISTAEVHPLTGSSAPGGAEPGFEPVTMAYFPNHLDRTPEQRLVDLNARFDRAYAFYQAACDADDVHPSKKTKETDAAVRNAIRIMKEIQQAAYVIPSTNVRMVALKARIMSEDKGSWWNHDSTDEDRDVRIILEDVLALGGVDRFHRRDFAFTDLLPGYAGPPRTVDEPAEVSAPQPSSCLLAIGMEMAVLHARHSELDNQFPQDPNERRAIDRKADLVLDCLRMKAEHASYMQAGSLADALVQILLLSAAIGDLDDDLLEPDEGPARLLANQDRRKVERLIWSIRGALEKATNLGGEAFGGNYFMSRNFDPFTAGGETVDAVLDLGNAA